MNVQRITLPDGTLVKIEGGTAADTAKFLRNRLAGNHVTRAETPLPLPTCNAREGLRHGPRIPGFPDTEPRKPLPDYSGRGMAGNTEEPLSIPSMNFANPAFGAGPDEEPFNEFAPPALADNEAPLGMPAMKF